MLGNDPTVLADHDAVRIGLDLNRPPDGARCHRVLVVIETHQTGLGDRGWYGMEAIEPTRIRHELGSLGLEDLPDGPVGELRLPMRLGVLDIAGAARQDGASLWKSCFAEAVDIDLR